FREARRSGLAKDGIDVLVVSPGLTQTNFSQNMLEQKAKLQLDLFFSSRRRHTRSVSAFLLNRSSDLTVKLSKYNVDDVALGVCKTGAEEAGVTEVRTSLSEKKFELWREIKV